MNEGREGQTKGRKDEQREGRMNEGRGHTNR